MVARALLCLVGLIAPQASSSHNLLKNRSSTSHASTSTAGPDDVTVGVHAAALGGYLQGLMDREVGTPLLQSLLNQLPYSSYPRNDSQTVFHIAQALESKVAVLSSMVRELREVADHLPSFPSSVPCCSLPAGQGRHYTKLGVAVQETLCELSSPLTNLPRTSSPVSSELSLLLHRHLSTPGLLWQFLLHPSGQEVIYPSPRGSCKSTSPHGHLLPRALNPYPRRTVILLDTAAYLTASQSGLAISAAQYLLSSLSPSDQAAVFLTSTNRALVPPNCRGGNSLFHPPLLLPLLDQIVSSSTNSQLQTTLTSALSVLFNSTSKPLPAQIVVISTLERLSTASSSLKQATARLPLTSTSVIVIQPVGPPQEIPTSLLKPHYVISPNTHIPSALEGWYQAPPPQDHKSPTPLFLPLQPDPLTSLQAVALSLPSSVGLVGIIVDLRAIAEEVIFQPSTGGGQAFLIGSEGKILAESSPSGEEVASYEPEKLLSTLKSRSNGKKRLGRVVYTWRKVQGSPYTVVLASAFNAPNQVLQIKNSNFVTLFHQALRLRPVVYSREGTDFQYHELILAGTSKLCRHLREAASMQAAALFLSPTAFSNPYGRVAGEEVPLRTQSFMAFLTDPTRLIANPGLRPGVRPDAATSATLVSHWRTQVATSPLNNYIVRRRVATAHGVLLSYPGTRFNSQDKDFTMEPWYLNAASQPGVLVVSAPSLDAGGAGYVVTMSQAIIQGNVSSGTSQPVAGVVSVDLTLGYFFKIINDSVLGARCDQDGTRCFLMERGGYLVSQPAHFQGARHITSAEPVVASALLALEEVMVKSECRRREDNTLQRLFTINLEQEEVLKSSKDSCTKWELSRVPGSSLILGVVKEEKRSCQASPAFCWCSTVDRTCLDCQRMEQGECECPCECPLQDLGCPADATQPPYCPPMASPPPSGVRHSTVRIDRLPPCIHTDCESLVSEDQCYGVLGCNWCSLAPDGYTSLANPFCARQEICYSGILSSLSPYSKLTDRVQVSPRSGDGDDQLLRASPIGPVAGGIMAFFLLLAATAWGYRHWSVSERRLLSGTGSLRVSLEEEGPDQQLHNGAHHNFGLGGGEAGIMPVVSPYRMNPGYRRPRAAGTDSSDHGYSTMTPFGDQDSEIMSCLGEPPPRKKTQAGQASVQSVTSGASSRGSSPTMQEEMARLVTSLPKKEEPVPGITVLPHQIVVAALVHKVEA